MGVGDPDIIYHARTDHTTYLLFRKRTVHPLKPVSPHGLNGVNCSRPEQEPNELRMLVLGELQTRSSSAHDDDR